MKFGLAWLWFEIRDKKIGETRAAWNKKEKSATLSNLSCIYKVEYRPNFCLFYLGSYIIKYGNLVATEPPFKSVMFPIEMFYMTILIPPTWNPGQIQQELDINYFCFLVTTQ